MEESSSPRPLLQPTDQGQSDNGSSFQGAPSNVSAGPVGAPSFAVVSNVLSCNGPPVIHTGASWTGRFIFFTLNFFSTFTLNLFVDRFGVSSGVLGLSLCHGRYTFPRSCVPGGRERVSVTGGINDDSRSMHVLNTELHIFRHPSMVVTGLAAVCSACGQNQWSYYSE
jgi:hypothetical protein